jgi:hypothetical protein
MADMFEYLVLEETVSVRHHEVTASPAAGSVLGGRPRNHSDSGAPRRPELTGHPIDAFRACPAVAYRILNEDRPKQGICGRS